jgi:hypothetical protein
MSFRCVPPHPAPSAKAPEIGISQNYLNETYDTDERGALQGRKRALKSTREKRGRTTKANSERTDSLVEVAISFAHDLAHFFRTQSIMARARNIFIFGVCRFCCESKSLL